MSIISEALKKVEGNSDSSPSVKKQAPQVELVDGFAKSSPPPLFSVWSIVLSTVMVLVAASLLFATWFMNRPKDSASGAAAPRPVSPPVKVVATPVATVPAEPVPVAPAVPAAPGAAPAAEPAAPEVQPRPTDPIETPAEPVKAPSATTTPPAETPATGVASSPEAEPAAKPEVKTAPAAPSKRDDLVLTGVVYTPRVRMAHINGKILPEGAKIRGYRIVSISRESVRLSKDEQFYILRLKR
ncbi:MAG: hypothetical protein QGH42_05325 [Kiritimatiellia bacterium]|jgi:hypothetical protein|nr:hypothetical protein [Kiritimatiellia bacterium]MDP6629932.1 hypothetical protein [Kiritimatiellia bacterium]MDP6810130.1 hypothetical protein [Kiritimatiellia bacterium]MDP7023652.1 hypothetical protein [Kiritimatiellia bacterium]